MSKKMNEINDIIDSAYTVADYSHGGGYYDKASEHGNRRNIYSSIPYHREHNGNSNSNSNGNNIFLKNSQTVNTNGNTNCNTNTNGNTNTGTNSNESCDAKKLALNDDNFPSLGCKPNSINKYDKIENKLDFKKMVEKKTIVPTKPSAPSLENSATNNRFKSNKFSLYNEIKERSEKIAKNKMIDEISSDDEI